MNIKFSVLVLGEGHLTHSTACLDVHVELGARLCLCEVNVYV